MTRYIMNDCAKTCGTFPLSKTNGKRCENVAFKKSTFDPPIARTREIGGNADALREIYGDIASTKLKFTECTAVMRVKSASTATSLVGPGLLLITENAWRVALCFSPSMTAWKTIAVL
jgi:hypothetical protein